MASLRRIGIDDVHERVLLLLDAESASEVPKLIDPGSKHFVSLIAWDARSVDAPEVARVARMLLDAGCVYFCCWGPGCERVHDIIDEEYVGDGTNIHDDGSTIMTTWHNDDTLEEAAWFTLNVAFPDDRFIDTCKAVIAIAIGNSAWKRDLENALSDPLALGRRVVGEDDQRPMR